MNKIKSGFFAVTEVTDPKGHVAYNWWHSSDHIPENIAIPQVVLGTRWAAPKKYVEARLGCHPAFAKHQYLVHYLMTDPIEEALQEFADLGARTRALGRFFGQREILMASHNTFLKGYVAPRIEIAPEALPYRPNKGVLVVMTDFLDPSKHQALAQYYDRVHVPDVLTVKGVMGCYWFKSRSAMVTGLPGIGDPANRHTWVYYLDEDPLVTMADLKAKLPQWRAAGRAWTDDKARQVVLACPYVSITNPWHYDVQEQ